LLFQLLFTATPHRSLNATVAQLKNYLFVVFTMKELKNITTTSDNNVMWRVMF
jgi:hypothetical protein